jgi:type I restriction enzyme S subunit
MNVRWAKVRLKDVVKINPFTRFPSTGDVDFFPMEAIEQGGGLIYGQSKSVSEAGGYSQFAEGDILYAKVTPCFENQKSAVANGLGQGVGLATTEVMVFRPSRRILAKFLLYRLQAFDFLQLGVNTMRGVGGLKRFPDQEAGCFEFLLPPLDEQARIVKFLDDEITLLEARANAFERKRGILAEAKQALRESAVFDRQNVTVPRVVSQIFWHGDVPAHWGLDRLGNLFREATNSGADDLPVLSVSIHTGISDRELGSEDGARKVSRSENKGLYKRVLPGDLVYNQMRAWQGGFGVARVEGLVSPAYVVARPNGKVSTEYVELLLRTPSAIEEMRRRSRGIIEFRLRLYWDRFKDIRIPLPPTNEQKAIVADLATKLSLLDEQVAKLDDVGAALRQQRLALVNDMVTGNVQVSPKKTADIQDLALT